MKKSTHLSRQLFEKQLITGAQLEAIEQYHERGLFSIRGEVRFLLFLSVMLFTGGVGVFIYEHIDTIGHMAILALILVVAAACYYYSFKHAPGFTKQEAPPQKPLYDYLVLAAHLLTGIFIGYLQYQYSPFGTHNDLATLLPTGVYFFGAYYFDHKGVLSLAIAGLCAFIGFSASPTGLLHAQFYDRAVAYYAIATAGAFILWTVYSQQQNLKVHFNGMYQNFALHIACVACISQLFNSYWLAAVILLTLAVYYFVDLAYKKGSAYFLSFTFIYGYIGLSCAIGRLAFLISSDDMVMLLAYLSPFYFAGAIVLFIKSLKHLKHKKHVSVQ